MGSARAGSNPVAVAFRRMTPFLKTSHSAQKKTNRRNARLAQLVERKALNLVVVGSSPTVGTSFSEWVFLVVNGRPPLRASVVGQRLLAAGMHITI